MPALLRGDIAALRAVRDGASDRADRHGNRGCGPPPWPSRRRPPWALELTERNPTANSFTASTSPTHAGAIAGFDKRDPPTGTGEPTVPDARDRRSPKRHPPGGRGCVEPGLWGRFSGGVLGCRRVVRQSVTKTFEEPSKRTSFFVESYDTPFDPATIAAGAGRSAETKAPCRRRTTWSTSCAGAETCICPRGGG